MLPLQRSLSAHARRAPAAIATMPSLAQRALSTLPSGPASASSSASPSSAASASGSSGLVRKSSLARKATWATLALGGAGGAAYYFSSRARSAPAVELPPFDLAPFSRYADMESFRRGVDLTLYQYETCPFCCKVRSTLDAMGVPYRVVEVNPLSKAEKKSAGPLVASTKTVPVLVVDGQVLVDSTKIMRSMNDLLNLFRAPSEKHVITPDEESALKFVDENVVILTAPNLYRTWGESLESFSYISRNSQLAASASAASQVANKYVGATVMYALTHWKLNKKYGITDARQRLYTAAREWAGALPASQPFRGGSQPNLADLACFGVFRALEPYAAGRDALKKENSGEKFVAWFHAVKMHVEQAKHKANA